MTATIFPLSHPAPPAILIFIIAIFNTFTFSKGLDGLYVSGGEHQILKLVALLGHLVKTE